MTSVAHWAWQFALILALTRLAGIACTRVKLPSVLGEIAVGIVLGPSVFEWVLPSNQLTVIAEIGAVVLLTQVGLDVDIDELLNVGRKSMSVAIVGVVAPLVLGMATARALGESTTASLFVGAALAATSIGVTARVFADLQILASIEARIVLGAAVADDVIGLILLGIVARIVQRGTLDIGAVAGSAGLAIAFVLAVVIVADRVMERLGDLIDVWSSSAGSITVLSVAYVFALASLSSAVGLAPIVGAFLAGLTLRRLPHRDRLTRDTATLASLFVPLFFASVGIETNFREFAHAHVFGIAMALTVVAVAGKVVAGMVAGRDGGRRLLIGVGMVPRGEVGLVFASVGVGIGAIGNDLRAVLVLVVVLTTVVAPPALSLLARGMSESMNTFGDVQALFDDSDTDQYEPAGGWVRRNGDSISLHGNPPSTAVLRIALETALHTSEANAEDQLTDWITTHSPAARGAFDEDTTQLFLDALMRGNSRTWRLLDATGVLRAAVPEMAAAFDARRTNVSQLDPSRALGLPTVEAARRRVNRVTTDDCALMVAALMCDINDDDVDSSRVPSRLHLDNKMIRSASALVVSSTLIVAAVQSEPFEDDPRVHSQLANYLADPVMVEQCRILCELRHPFEDWQYSALLQITIGVQAMLAHPELLDGANDTLESLRRREASDLIPFTSINADDIRARIETADSQFILSHDVADIARLAAFAEPSPTSGEVRVRVAPADRSNLWRVTIACRDTRALLARIAGALSASHLSIVSASLATWSDGVVVDTFTVNSPSTPDESTIARELRRALTARRPKRTSSRDGELRYTVDNLLHPLHSIVTVSGPDRIGALQDIAATFTSEKIVVLHARIATTDGRINDRFEVCDTHGQKLGTRTIARLHKL